MFLKSTQLKQLALISSLSLQLTACNETEFFEKEFLSSDDNNSGTTIICKGNCATGGGGGGGLTPGDGGNDDGGNIGGGGNTGGGGDDGGNVGGEPTPTYKDLIDSYTQNASEQRPIDILWVVDNSGSMGDEQTSLAYNFDIFIQDFVTKDVDFQMAITTTDGTSSHEGKAVGDFSLLNKQAAQNDTQAFIDYFAEKIYVGTNGSGIEKGLNGMRKFIETDGASWIRKDAFLVVVVISDEEDQSYSSVSSYIDFLKSLKTNDRLINVNSIVTYEDEAFGDPTRGQRYMDVSDATGGVIANIENNFHDILDNMGGTILDLISSFPLSSTPVDGTIEVYVDGTKVTNGWEYNKSNNSINFLKGHVPDENAAIQIKYKVEVN